MPMRTTPQGVAGSESHREERHASSHVSLPHRGRKGHVSTRGATDRLPAFAYTHRPAASSCAGRASWGALVDTGAPVGRRTTRSSVRGPESNGSEPAAGALQARRRRRKFWSQTLIFHDFARLFDLSGGALHSAEMHKNRATPTAIAAAAAAAAVLLLLLCCCCCCAAAVAAAKRLSRS